jgi:hypothetical protein
MDKANKEAKKALQTESEDFKNAKAQLVGQLAYTRLDFVEDDDLVARAFKKPHELKDVNEDIIQELEDGMKVMILAINTLEENCEEVEDPMETSENSVTSESDKEESSNKEEDR